MGKTALATNIAYNVAKGASRRGPGRRHDEVHQRRYCRLLLLRKCPPNNLPPVFSPSRPVSPRATIRRGGITETELREDPRLLDRIAVAARFYVDETGGLSISQLTARARRLEAAEGPRSDRGRLYSNCCRARGKARQRQPRAGKSTEITTSLKALAKELNVPIIALSQLVAAGREPATNKRPPIVGLA